VYYAAGLLAALEHGARCGQLDERILRSILREWHIDEQARRLFTIQQRRDLPPQREEAAVIASDSRFGQR